MSWMHPEDYRWTLGRRSAHGPTSISVIEPPDDEKPKRGGRKVPFGFAREIPTPEAEPLLFEGEGA